MPKVLLIDAQAQLLTLLKGKFEREGFDVLSTSSGDEGVRLARHERPDLIVLEARLRDGAGAVVADRIKDDVELQKIPLILLTLRTEGSDEDADEIQQVQHPFSPKRLVELALESL